MARVVVWSPEAVEDVEAIAAYIQRDSSWYAKAAVSKIVDTVESIPEFPELGRTLLCLKSATSKFVNASYTATGSFIDWMQAVF